MFVASGTDLDALADRVMYVGSPEHKDIPSFVGQPRLRGDASRCRLRSSIRRGATGAPWEGELPRYVWYKFGATMFEGRLVNREAGTYKGYPLNEDEWPNGIEAIYAET